MYLFTYTYVCEFEKYINMYIYTDPYDYEKTIRNNLLTKICTYVRADM